jgi:uncharacterized protein (TIGR02145 family)
MKKTILTLFTLGFLGASSTYAQVGIGTQTPDASAILELESTEKGFLPPRMTTAERDLISSPAEGLLIYNTDNQCLELVNGNNDWISLCEERIVITVAPSVVSANGRIWMDRNLGASEVANASNHGLSYGHRYQWGRTSDGHQIDNLSIRSGPVNANTEGSDFITSSNNNWLTARDDSRWGNPTDEEKGPHDPCPAGFRLPSEAEFIVETNSWDSSISNTPQRAFSSPLKLPSAGLRKADDAFLFNVGGAGYYWTSTISGDQAKRLALINTFLSFGSVSRANGLSVRCIKD